MKKRKTKKIENKRIRWFWEWEAHKYWSYHSRKKIKRFHYTLFYSIAAICLFILAFASVPPYSIYLLIAAIGVSCCVLYWVWKNWKLGKKLFKRKRKREKRKKLLKNITKLRK